MEYIRASLPYSHTAEGIRAGRAGPRVELLLLVHALLLDNGAHIDDFYLVSI